MNVWFTFLISLLALWILYRRINKHVFDKVKNFEPFTKNTLPLIGDLHFAIGLSINSKNY